MVAAERVLTRELLALCDIMEDLIRAVDIDRRTKEGLNTRLLLSRRGLQELKRQVQQEEE